MTRTIWTLACSLVLTGCVTDSTPAPDVSTKAACEALRPAFPLKYHGKTDESDTIKGIQQANARYAAICS